VTITNNYRGIVASKDSQDKFKIKFEVIPSQMEMRWELKDVRQYLDSKDEQINIDGKVLFEDMRKKYEHYCFYRSDVWYDVNVLWDLGTYLHQLFSHYPIKEEKGLKGTAKSKTMDISIQFTLNPTERMINPSEATLFRYTEELRPTKYIDEAERLFQKTKGGFLPDSRVELINASYSMKGCVPRQEKIGNRYVTKLYHTYSPTRIGSINGMYGATEDRCITQIHTKIPDNDTRGETEIIDDENDISWKKIRNRIYRWSLGNWKEVEKEYLNFNIQTNIKKRDLQLWKPLLVLAKLIDEEELLPKIIKFSERLSNQKKEDNISSDSQEYLYLDCMNDLLLGKIQNLADDKIYISEISHKLKQKYEHYFNENNFFPKNKTISNKLDKLGFQEYRLKDRMGSYYKLTKNLFDDIISPLTTDFSSHSSHSSHSSQTSVNNENKSDECVTNNDEYNNNKKLKCDDVTDNDESDGHKELNKEIKPEDFK